jgi:hypothetical protein
LLRARLPWCKIEKVTFNIMKNIMSIRLEELMLRNFILLLIVLIYTVMRLVVLDIQLILRCLRKKIVDASNEHSILFKTFDASFVLTNKSGKLVAKYVGGQAQESKDLCWVSKVLVSNVKGPKIVWVPKDKA